MAALEHSLILHVHRGETPTSFVCSTNKRTQGTSPHSVLCGRTPRPHTVRAASSKTQECSYSPGGALTCDLRIEPPRLFCGVLWPTINMRPPKMYPWASHGCSHGSQQPHDWYSFVHTRPSTHLARASCEPQQLDLSPSSPPSHAWLYE